MSRGRPIAIEPSTAAAPSSPRCERCRFLRIDEAKAAYCGHWRVLDPLNCPDFHDVSRSRDLPAILIHLKGKK